MTEYEPFIDTKELLKRLPVSKSMITKLCNCAENPLPHVRLGNRYAFLWSQVNNWLLTNALS